MNRLLVLALLACCVGFTLADGTTASEEDECAQYTDKCETCVKHSSCLWCSSKEEDKRCVHYPKGSLLPDKETCPLDDARWGVCWVNYKALLISFGVIAGVVVLLITGCCVYCCCCRGNGRNTRKYERDMARMDRDQEDRRVKSDERRAERQTKYDDIRKKYGITKDDGYNRFDNE